LAKKKAPVLAAPGEFEKEELEAMSRQFKTPKAH
jgi:hypothetical protein